MIRQVIEELPRSGAGCDRARLGREAAGSLAVDRRRRPKKGRGYLRAAMMRSLSAMSRRSSPHFGYTVW